MQYEVRFNPKNAQSNAVPLNPAGFEVMQEEGYKKGSATIFVILSLLI